MAGCCEFEEFFSSVKAWNSLNSLSSINYMVNNTNFEVNE
jgi:hypothetical protein